MRNLFRLNIHPIPTHPKALLFACQNSVGNLYEPLMAEIRSKTSISATSSTRVYFRILLLLPSSLTVTMLASYTSDLGLSMTTIRRIFIAISIVQVKGRQRRR